VSDEELAVTVPTGSVISFDFVAFFMGNNSQAAMVSV
jgi:hypothetical protein